MSRPTAPMCFSRIEDIVVSPPLVYLHLTVCTLPLFFTLYFFLRRNFTLSFSIYSLYTNKYLKIGAYYEPFDIFFTILTFR